MKYIVEDKDIEEVKEVASSYYGILLTDEQAKEFIDNNSSIREDLFNDGLSDTCARSNLVNVIVDKVLHDVKCINEDSWEFPCNGSKPTYKAEFNCKFTAACEKHKIKLEKGCYVS